MHTYLPSFLSKLKSLFTVLLYYTHFEHVHYVTSFCMLFIYTLLRCRNLLTMSYKYKVRDRKRVRVEHLFWNHGQLLTQYNSHMHLSH